MKGKDLKQAKVIMVKIDKERPLTFDFNALCELQDSFIDPFIAVGGLATGDVKCMRALLHASLVAGQMAKDESVEFDLTMAQVGRFLGQIMSSDKELYDEIFKAILEGVALFFPEKEEKEEGKEEDSKN